jgi:hypothetical protein
MRASEKPDPPFVFRNLDTEVFIHDGKNLHVNFGLTDLLPPRTMTCHSPAGCKISVSLIVNITKSTGVAYEICSTIDGVTAKPGCYLQDELSAVYLQSLKVSQGPHVIETQFQDNGASGVIGGWQVNYTLYEGR